MADDKDAADTSKQKDEPTPKNGAASDGAIGGSGGKGGGVSSLTAAGNEKLPQTPPKR